MYNHTESAHPVVIFIRGIPGSGKSYLAQSLKNELGEELVLIDPDATDHQSSEYIEMSKQLSESGVDEKFHPYRYLRAQAYRAIEARKIIVWNQALISLDGLKKTISNLDEYAINHDTSLSVLNVEVEIDEATARDRILEREKQGGHAVPQEKFDQFVRDYKSFSEEEFRTIKVDGSDDIKHSTQAVINELNAEK